MTSYRIVDAKNGQGNTELEHDWQEMIQRFQVLAQTLPYNADINDYLRVLKKNQPTKSLRRKYWECMLELEARAKALKARAREEGK